MYPFEQYAVHLAGNLQKLMVTTPLFYANGSPHIGAKPEKWGPTASFLQRSIKVWGFQDISRGCEDICQVQAFLWCIFWTLRKRVPCYCGGCYGAVWEAARSRSSLCDWHGWTWREDCANSGSLAARGPSWDVMGCLIKINKVFNKDVLSTEYAQLK